VYRKELPRLYELIDRRPQSPDAYFVDLGTSLGENGVKLKHFRHIEEDLRGLDPDSWEQLKAELIPLFTARDAKRGWQALFDKLNEAKGYNHLARVIGCTSVRFIPRSKRRGQRTPDLEGSLGSVKVLCEVKTINISEIEKRHRNDHTVRTISNQLQGGFFDKLKSDLEAAGKQMVAYCSVAKTRRIAYVIVNYDDLLHEYAHDYSKQIDAFIACNPVPGLEVYFDIKPPFYSATA
jgi:hypothetical protein